MTISNGNFYCPPNDNFQYRDAACSQHTARPHIPSFYFPPDQEACFSGVDKFPSFGSPIDEASSETSMSSEVREGDQKVCWSRPDVLVLLTLFSERKARFKDLNIKKENSVGGDKY